MWAMSNLRGYTYNMFNQFYFFWYEAREWFSVTEVSSFELSSLLFEGLQELAYVISRKQGLSWE